LPAERVELRLDATKVGEVAGVSFGPRVQGYEPIPDGMMRFRTVWLKVVAPAGFAHVGRLVLRPSSRHDTRPAARHGRRSSR